LWDRGCVPPTQSQTDPGIARALCYNWTRNNLKTDLEKNLALIRQMAALHERLALMEMTKHEFLDKNYRKERTTFADGTTVTVDWDASTFEISPELKPSR
jgi:hypothetical protein